ncbi:SOS response-associated peptidase [Algoriphagus sediminis]|uniref:Abasic site processing protein n=1 Tax=Algoriphagus sediminis TaxID=3057113 RepID=A0ABT7Y824_9BACT|nr:SOS response-associated peptidase [Algoriphagus sediminis]MDN3202605.1 SOS response-associated peptidase [Algoriphagus sediminis]
MCGRYSLGKNKKDLEERFSAEMLSEFEPRYNIAPTQLVPVITSQSPKGFSFFYWGITPDFGRNRPVSQKLINAKSETVDQKVSFKKSFQSRRCIVPADGFYEWKRLGKKTKIPYRFQLEGNSLFSFAGIWDEYETVSGDVQHTFLILTTGPNDTVEQVHDRMPVIFGKEQEKKWLDPYSSPEELKELLIPLSNSKLDSFTVSPSVNSVQNDYPSLINKISPADQHGNYTLFG